MDWCGSGLEQLYSYTLLPPRCINSRAMDDDDESDKDQQEPVENENVT